MNVKSYRVKPIDKEENFVYFDADFFTFIEEELKKTNASQLPEEMQKYLHEQIITKIIPENYSSFPCLLSRIIKITNGKFEIRIVAPPMIFSVYLDLEISQKGMSVQNKEKCLIEEVIRKPPLELDPEKNPNIFALLNEDIQRFEKRKNMQRNEFEQGQRYLIFHSEKKPGLIPPVSKEDLIFESMAPCLPRFEEMLSQRIDLENDYKNFKELSKKLNSLLIEIAGDLQLKPYAEQQLKEYKLTEESLQEQAIYFATKNTLSKELLDNFNSDDDLKNKFVSYIAAMQYLTFYKEYLAWALHSSACSYHAHIQEETENENRLKKIEAFKNHFSSIVAIDKDGSVPSLREFKRAFSVLTLDAIAEILNSFLKKECNTSYFHSSDKQKILVKSINDIGVDIQSILASCGLNFSPFVAWEKGWMGLSQAGFKWSKEAEELEKLNTKSLQEIVTISLTDNKYSELTNLYPAPERKNLANIEKAYQLFNQRIQQRQEILLRKRQEKKSFSIKKATELQEACLQLNNNIKKLLIDLNDQTLLATMIANETDIKSLCKSIIECDYQKIRVSLNAKHKHKPDILDKNLAALSLLQVEFEKRYDDVQAVYRRNALNKALQISTQAKQNSDKKMTAILNSFQRIKRNYDTLNAQQGEVDALTLKFSDANSKYQCLESLRNDITSINTLPLQCQSFAALLDEKCQQIQLLLTSIETIKNELNQGDALTSKAAAIKILKEKIEITKKNHLAALPELTTSIQKRIHPDNLHELNTTLIHLKKLVPKLDGIQEEVELKSIEAVDANELITYLDTQTTNLDNTIESIHSQLKNLQILDKSLSKNETLSQAKELEKKSQEIYQFSNNQQSLFYNYLSDAAINLADQLPLSATEALKKTVMPRMQAYLEKIAAEVKTISELNVETNLDPAVFYQVLKEKLQSISQYHHALCELEHNFIVKAHAELLSQATYIKSLLIAELKKITDLKNDEILSAERKNFNVISLQLETLLKLKINNDELHLARLNANIYDIDALLIELHKSFQRMTDRQTLIIAERRAAAYRREVEQQATLNQHQQKAVEERERNIKIVTGALLMAVFTVGCVFTAGTLALVSGAIAGTALLCASGMIGAGIGATAGYAADQISPKVNDTNSIKKFFNEHQKALKWTGGIFFGALTLAGVVGLTVVSLGLAPAIVATVGVATAASFSALTGTTMSATFGAILSCSLFAGWSLLAGTAVAVTPNSKVPLPQQALPHNNNPLPNASDETVSETLEQESNHDLELKLTRRSTNEIQQTFAKQEQDSHLVAVESNLKNNFLQSENSKECLEKASHDLEIACDELSYLSDQLSKKLEIPRVKHSQSQLVLFPKVNEREADLRRSNSLPSSFKLNS